MRWSEDSKFGGPQARGPSSLTRGPSCSKTGRWPTGFKFGSEQARSVEPARGPRKVPSVLHEGLLKVLSELSSLQRNKQKQVSGKFNLSSPMYPKSCSKAELS
jgi:hypothetical protein